MDKLLSGRRVLVVEDEVLVLIMIEDMLADLGRASVTGDTTVHQAIALIESQNFDASMQDMNLNGNMTYRVADALTAHHVALAFSTGYSSDDIRDGYRDRPVLRTRLWTSSWPRSSGNFSLAD